MAKPTKATTATKKPQTPATPAPAAAATGATTAPQSAPVATSAAPAPVVAPAAPVVPTYNIGKVPNLGTGNMHNTQRTWQTLAAHLQAQGPQTVAQLQAVAKAQHNHASFVKYAVKNGWYTLQTQAQHLVAINVAAAAAAAAATAAAATAAAAPAQPVTPAAPVAK